MRQDVRTTGPLRANSRVGGHGMDNWTAVFEQDGEWWVGSVEELPGALTQGRTLEEARENLREAVLLILEVNAEIVLRSRPASS